MNRLALLLIFLSAELFACTGNFSSCRQKLIDSHSLVNTQLQIALSDSRRLVYADRTPESVTVVKEDPFLGLYLIEDTQPFRHPFSFDERTAKQVAAIDELFIVPGAIVQAQQGLNRLARFDQPVAEHGILTDPCCSLLGVITERGLIEKVYLEHFLEEGGNYADAGMRAETQNGKIMVTSVDPYFTGNPFKTGDRIIGYKHKKARSAEAFMQTTLFHKPGASVNINVEREGVLRELTVTLQPRFGGGLISDTYLERLGIRMDAKLQLTHIENRAQKLGLRTGDRVLRLNGTAVSSHQELRHAVSNAGQGASMLIERDGFQFFIALP